MGDQLMMLHGFQVVRFSQARASQQTEGIPDRRYYHTEWGVAIWWEAKREGGKQRPAQKRFQVMCEACGEWYVVGPLDVLQAQLERMCRYYRSAQKRPPV